MPWKDHLKSLKQDLGNIIQGPGRTSQPPPQEQHGPPPPPRPELPSQSVETYWQPKFSPGVSVSSEWETKIGNGTDGWGNQELEFYTAETQNSFHTDNGLLVLRAIANSASPNHEQRFTSARLVSRQTLARDKGFLNAVILSPCAQGIWPAFWLLPKEPFAWPTDGEIDIAETWNGDRENHSCYHWGFHHEPHKHRVRGTRIDDMPSRPVKYGFAWDQSGQAGQGRMVWYIDGRPVMKAPIADGTRPMRDMTLLLNVAMGGNVCQGKIPADGYYDMVVYNLSLTSEPEQGGWAGFERDWRNTPDGSTY